VAEGWGLGVDVPVAVASGRGVGVEAGVWVDVGSAGWDATVATTVGERALTTEAVGLKRGAVVGDRGTEVARWGAGVGVGVRAARATAGVAMLSSSHPTATEYDSLMHPD